MGHLRIRRVRFKNGGPDIRVIRQETPDKGGENWKGKVVEHARSIAEYSRPSAELIGFVTIGLYSDGSYSMGSRWDADRSLIPARLMPSYIAELIREELIIQDNIRAELE